jgi:hypothetical protein
VATLFLSHSKRDVAVTVQVRDWLVAEGFRALFVDFDKTVGFPAGSEWERVLYARLRASEGLIFLASAASVSSQWCFAEVVLARSLGLPVFPVRVDPDAELGLLTGVQWVDLRDSDALGRLRCGLERAGLTATSSLDWDSTRSPYPGLRPFDVEDAAVFFGRGVEIDKLQDLFRPTLQRGPGRFVAIIGPSGSGKSSLMRAGLLPRLGRRPGAWVVVPPMRPGKFPLRSLARSISDAFAAAGPGPPSTDDVWTRLERGAGGLVELVSELAEVGRVPAQDVPSVLLVIDQAEELATLSGPEAGREFLDLLVTALKESVEPLWALATVRSEHLATAPDRAGLAEAINDPVVIEPLRSDRLSEVIAKPARRAGLEFEPGLVERMVRETAGGDALPLLAYTLSELYERRGADDRVTTSDYEAAGGVVGTLRRRADRVLHELERDQGPPVVPVLLKLATISDDGEPLPPRPRRSLQQRRPGHHGGLRRRAAACQWPDQPWFRKPERVAATRWRTRRC